eukprot:CAMPEP_0118669382 /NCGR_PEP_ID=MMETSP0785-20121206/20866_1 /TAXON_ID=91992 /ORGANISM="Bolidomonas pacifica, Strain CCMP 1866" /LENGTH=263 /DNA_ID=CAMNT_0006564051 /DNA_START=158 /DNA_END=946 /DNA_ORIENTATION=+
MGQSSSSIYSKSQLDVYCKPVGKVDRSQGWTAKQIRKRIGSGHLAPRLPPTSTYPGSECLICFEDYTRYNVTTCCNKVMCTECYLQVQNAKNELPCSWCQKKGGTVRMESYKQKQERMQKLQQSHPPSSQPPISPRSAPISTPSSPALNTPPNNPSSSTSTPPSFGSSFGSALDNYNRSRTRSRTSSTDSCGIEEGTGTLGSSPMMSSVEERQRLENEIRSQIQSTRSYSYSGRRTSGSRQTGRSFDDVLRLLQSGESSNLTP